MHIEWKNPINLSFKGFFLLDKHENYETDASESRFIDLNHSAHI